MKPGTPRILARGGLAVTSVAALTAVALSTATQSSAATACGTLFDDFSYSSGSDPTLSQHGWSVRTDAGGPGVPGASWLSGNVSFPTVDGQRVAQLRASTNGTAGGTTQAEFSQSNRRFFEGTYLARIKFADAPASGSDGDHLNQTFYSISPLRYPMDPIYSELDYSEYLPNGGWGEGGPVNYQTTWYTYQDDPWVADNQESKQSRSIAGWHDVMATVAGGQVTYYIDGQVVGTHGGKYYPRQNMSIDFNQWFIDVDGHSGGGTSVWQESVDYVLHVKKQALSPAQANAQVAAYRGSGVAYADNVTADNGCDPGGGSQPTRNQLGTGGRLTSGQQLTSSNGRFHLNLQTDGNLVIYDGSSPIWATGTWNLPSGSRPTRAEMQADGNLVLYNDANQPAWASGSWGSDRVNPFVELQDDGNLVIYHNGRSPLWASGTQR
ncbi:MAG: hypothetical protein QOC94_165 [Actinoplanes sp.]|nr:hypothetical protein [Actinoplanes sp.]